jgi:hypothetical protein
MGEEALGSIPAPKKERKKKRPLHKDAFLSPLSETKLLLSPVSFTFPESFLPSAPSYVCSPHIKISFTHVGVTVLVTMSSMLANQYILSHP